MQEIVLNGRTIQNKGCRIILMGDFNGHVKVEDGGAPREKVTNVNGRRIKQIAEELNFRHMEWDVTA